MPSQLFDKKFCSGRQEKISKIYITVTLWEESQIDGLVLDCSNSSVLAMELLQSCAKPSKWPVDSHHKGQ